MTTIDLNCDLGEGFGAWEMGNDAAMIELATSVNIACGFHAGDADIMRMTVELAKARGVSIGAHPGYRDLHGFGRRPFPGMKAAGDVDGGRKLDHSGVIAHFPCAKTFAEIAIEIDCGHVGVPLREWISD